MDQLGDMVRVDLVEGVVTGYAAGSATMSASMLGKAGSANISMTSIPVSLAPVDTLRSR